MSTFDIIRHLAESKDPHAMLALKKQALRTDDRLLLEYVQETANARLAELNLELELWKNCAACTLQGIGPALILKAVGPKKIQVIKTVRTVTGLGLKEAKSLVDNAPSVLVKNIALPQQAEQALGLFTAVGATALWGDPTTLAEQFNMSTNGAVNHLKLENMPGYVG
jgi:hypothetical protein